MLKVWITAKVKETVQLYFKSEAFTVDKPDLVVKVYFDCHSELSKQLEIYICRMVQKTVTIITP